MSSHLPPSLRLDGRTSLAIGAARSPLIPLHHREIFIPASIHTVGKAPGALAIHDFREQADSDAEMASTLARIRARQQPDGDCQDGLLIEGGDDAEFEP